MLYRRYYTIDLGPVYAPKRQQQAKLLTCWSVGNTLTRYPRNSMEIEHFRYLASYNCWINDALYGHSANLSDEQRRQDCAAFFGSIHGTLNHLLLADRVWMGRFEGCPYTPSSLGVELYRDFSELRAARRAEDERISNWIAGLTQEIVDRDFSYTSIVNPAIRSMRFGHAVTHFFNHQTHHRGQITTLLTQFGVDYGVTDMIALPGIVTVSEI